MLKIQTFVTNPFYENTYLVSDESGEAIIVDPGNYTKQENQHIAAYLSDHNFRVRKIVNTHAHVDHILGVRFLKDLLKVPFVLHKDEQATLRTAHIMMSNYGFPGFAAPEVDEWIGEGEEVLIGDDSLEILFAPGHAPGHIALINRAQKFVIGGDVLFRQSIGRTDLPGGDFNTLLSTIKTKFLPLGDDFTIYSGHGEPTTIGHEKKFNPFLQ